MKKLILILTFIASSVCADYYFLLTNQTYIVNSNPFYISDRVARIENAVEQIETNASIIFKSSELLALESRYTNALIRFGFTNAWNNTNYTFGSVAVTLSDQVMSATDEQAPALKARIDALQFLYNSFVGIIGTYGITDPRLYPYGESWIISNETTKIYIEHENVKYYKQ